MGVEWRYSSQNDKIAEFFTTADFKKYLIEKKSTKRFASTGKHLKNSDHFI